MQKALEIPIQVDDIIHKFQAEEGGLTAAQEREILVQMMFMLAKNESQHFTYFNYEFLRQQDMFSFHLKYLLKIADILAEDQ